MAESLRMHRTINQMEAMRIAMLRGLRNKQKAGDVQFSLGVGFKEPAELNGKRMQKDTFHIYQEAAIVGFLDAYLLQINNFW